MTRAWSVREAQASEWPRIRDLMQTCFGYVRPLSYDRWLYDIAPFGKALSFVAVAGDRIVGHEGLLPTQMRLGKEVLLGAQSMDTMTDPEFRGQGMFVEVAKACFEEAAKRGIEVLYGFPNPTSKPGLLRLNWDHTGNVPWYTRPLAVSRLIPGVVGRLGESICRLLPSGSADGFEYSFGRPSPAELEELLTRWREGKRMCRVERSHEWLDWRYDPRSGIEFEWTRVYRDGRLSCVAVRGTRGSAWGAAQDGVSLIFDIIADDLRASRAALSTMVRRALAEGAVLMKASTSDRSLGTLLLRSGFVPRRARPLMVRAQTARLLGENMHEHDSWRLHAGDQDAY